MDIRSYPSDLTDEEWAIVEPLLERSHPVGRDQTYSLRRIIDAILSGWTLTVTRHWWTGKSGFWVAPGQQPPEILLGFHVMPRWWVVERPFAEGWTKPANEQGL